MNGINPLKKQIWKLHNFKPLHNMQAEQTCIYLTNNLRTFECMIFSITKHLNLFLIVDVNKCDFNKKT